jgi:PII-like signaling protein
VSDLLKLTVYHGERARIGRAFAADALTDAFARHALRTSLLLRGIEGFGAHHRLRTDRLLTLSEDLPLVSLAVDERERVLAALADVEALPLRGLVTLERMTGSLREGAAKLTVHLGRREGHRAVVGALHRHGAVAAIALLGVDGTAGGVRERARFFSRNAAVPLMVVAVGPAASLAAALPELPGVATLERVELVDGDALAPAPEGMWRKLTVHSDEDARVHHRLVRRLRAAGAAGATCLRGVWGYHGAAAPHGDRLGQLRRRVPVATVTIDAPDRAARWLAIAREEAADALVTAEAVPVSIPAGAVRLQRDHPIRRKP